MEPQRIAQAELHSIALNRLTNEIEIASRPRNRAAAALFGIATDHHNAIIFLLKNTFYSSGFALLRCLFDAYLRGLWLKHCATDDQVAGFFKGVEPPTAMISEIEATPAFSEGVLSRIKKNYWSAMCDFTHTGGLHIQRWQSSNFIEPNFSLKELEECLNSAELFGTMAAFSLVQLSKAENDGSSVLNLMKSRWPK